jgi:hypothetical protein
VPTTIKGELINMAVRSELEDKRLLKVPVNTELVQQDFSVLADCLETHTNFVNGTVTYGSNSYTIAELATWAAYQIYKSPFYGILPPAWILVHWGIETGWSASTIQNRWNPGNQRALCGFSGTSDGTPTGTSFNGPNEGIKSYVKLLIEGYSHIQYAYSHAGFGDTGLNAAATALYNGYYSSYGGPSTSYCSSSTYSLDGPSGARPWTTTGGYEGFYNTIVNRSCIYAYKDLVYDDPGLPGMTNLY